MRTTPYPRMWGGALFALGLLATASLAAYLPESGVGLPGGFEEDQRVGTLVTARGPIQSSPIALNRTDTRLVNCNPDADTVTIFSIVID